MDEDTSATNFMIRDERMRELVEKEPISPFIDVVRPVAPNALGVSTVLVVGGVGDYLDVADRIILMEDYLTPRRHRTIRSRSDGSFRPGRPRTGKGQPAAEDPSDLGPLHRPSAWQARNRARKRV